MFVLPRPVWVQTGKAQREHMVSALPLRADIAQQSPHVRFVPKDETARAVGRCGWRHSQDDSATGRPVL